MRHAKSRARVRRRRALVAAASALSIAAAVFSAGGALVLDDVGLAWVADATALGSGSHGEPKDKATVPTPSGSPVPPSGVPSTTSSATPTPSPVTTLAPPRSPAPTDLETAPARATSTPVVPTTPDVDEPLPANSGQGKRIVYTLKTNHVWLVRANGTVRRDYLVSGTKFGQVEPATYEVLRKRRHTTSFHGTESMEYMVTFTEGENAAIGFHDIPISLETGEPIQTLDQLGESLSAGCVRQAEPDARALWEFAPVGTKVVVLP